MNSQYIIRDQVREQAFGLRVSALARGAGSVAGRYLQEIRTVKKAASKSTEYARRRNRLMNLMGDDSIAVLAAAPARLRNRDVYYPYRPDSDFFYLSGFQEPDAVLVLVPGRERGEFLLFCRERDPKRELWDGARAGLEGARREHGADDAFPTADLDEIMPGLLEGRRSLFYTMGRQAGFDRRVVSWVERVRGAARSGLRAPEGFISLDGPLHEMRLHKNREEVRILRQASRITVEAHRRAMRACRPGLMEYQLEAELLHEFMRRGARAPAYPSIVGGGANSCVLHYMENAAPLREGDLVLVDAGAEYRGYASDVTRTYPINGRFSKAQRAVYEVVLRAQMEAIDAVRVGAAWRAPHNAAVRALTEGLVELGILRGAPEKLIKQESYKPYFMHSTSHWLGMDVHDVGDYKVDGAWRALEPGMVLTVEPGLYLRPDGKDGARGLDRRWWNIGVRIEDDVVVTQKGPEVLTSGAPRSVEAIQECMADAA